MDSQIKVFFAGQIQEGYDHTHQAKKNVANHDVIV